MSSTSTDNEQADGEPAEVSSGSSPPTEADFDAEQWIRQHANSPTESRSTTTSDTTDGSRPEGLPAPLDETVPDEPITRLLGHAALDRQTLKRLIEGHREGWFKPTGPQQRVFDVLSHEVLRHPDDYGDHALVTLDEVDARLVHEAASKVPADEDRRQRLAVSAIDRLRHDHWRSTTYGPAVKGLNQAVRHRNGDATGSFADLQRAMADRPVRADSSLFARLDAIRVGRDLTDHPPIAYTGFPTLDEGLLGWETYDARGNPVPHRGGLRQGHLVLLCGPSGYGKSSLALEIMARAHKARCQSPSVTRRAGLVSMFFSGEMTPRAVLDKWGLVDPRSVRHLSRNRWWLDRRFDVGEEDPFADVESDFMIIFKEDDRHGVRDIEGIVRFVRDYATALVEQYRSLRPPAEEDRRRLEQAVLRRLPMIITIDYLNLWVRDLTNPIVDLKPAAIMLREQLTLGRALDGLPPFMAPWRPVVLLLVQAHRTERDRKDGSQAQPDASNIKWCKELDEVCDLNLMLWRPWESLDPANPDARICAVKNREGRTGVAEVAFTHGVWLNPSERVGAWGGYTNY